MAVAYFIFCFSLINTLFIFFFAGDFFLGLSFFLHFVIVTAGLGRALAVKYLHMDLIVWMFHYIFFIFAPLVQIRHGVFPNNLPIVWEEVVAVNLMLVAWAAVYFTVRRQGFALQQLHVPASIINVSTYTRSFFFIASGLMFLITFALFQLDFLFGHAGWEDRVENSAFVLILSIAVRGIVLGNVLFMTPAFVKNKPVYLPAFVLSVLMLIYFVNPFNVPRYYLAFVLITVIMLYARNRVTTMRFFGIFLAGMFIVFPFINIFRDGFQEVRSVPLSELAFNQLLELHFDAYANMIATMHFVAENGFQYGRQLLGSVLFFLPREWWEAKPQSSGELIGDFLIYQGYLEFNNLANALPSEMYIDFGLFGIILVPFLLAKAINKIEANIRPATYLGYTLAVGFIFYIYRGAFMSGFAYFTGTLVILFVLPFLIDHTARWMKVSVTGTSVNKRFQTVPSLQKRKEAKKQVSSKYIR